jgi:hypothetical protein
MLGPYTSQGAMSDNPRPRMPETAENIRISTDERAIGVCQSGRKRTGGERW